MLLPRLFSEYAYVQFFLCAYTSKVMVINKIRMQISWSAHLTQHSSTTNAVLTRHKQTRTYDFGQYCRCVVTENSTAKTVQKNLSDFALSIKRVDWNRMQRSGSWTIY